MSSLVLGLFSPPASPSFVSHVKRTFEKRPFRKDLRSSLVPAARGWTLNDLMKEVDDYGEATGNKVRMDRLVTRNSPDFLFERGLDTKEGEQRERYKRI